MWTQSARVQLEEAMQSCHAPLESSVVPRWRRKELEAERAKSVSAKTPGKKKAAAKTPSGKTPKGDRFIPSRSGGLDLEGVSKFHVGGGESPSVEDRTAGAAGAGGRVPLRAALAESLLGGGGEVVGEGGSSASGATGAEVCEEAKEGVEKGHRVLAFSSKAPAPPPGHKSGQRVLYSQSGEAGVRGRASRHIPSAPERILDAPDLMDDYYLNVLDWGKEDVLAVALGPTVYLWNAASGEIDELMTCPGESDYVSSVSWVKEGGGVIAVGTSSAEVLLWDCNRMKQVRKMKGHRDRVGAMDWNTHTLASGGRDSQVLLHDVRVKKHLTGRCEGHTQEVCALRWSPDGSAIASGGNDNLVCVWDAASALAGVRGGGVSMASSSASVGSIAATLPRHTLTDHRAAVKALAWCPWERHTLATGGGTADRCIRVWDASSGSALAHIDTGSQVTALLWNPHHKEIASAHGFAKNEIAVWKYPSLVKVKELTGHSARVLHLAAAPDQNTVVSAGADETLRFWKLFGEKPKKKPPATHREERRGAATGGGRGVKGKSIR